MKVLFIQDHLRCGGTEWQTIHLLNGLKHQGIEVFLITFRPGGALAERVQDANLPWSVLQKVDSYLNWWAPDLIRNVKALSPQVIILMGREANSLGFRLKKAFPDIKIIGTLRTGRNIPSRYQKSLSHSDCIVANSKWAYKRLCTISQSLQDRSVVIKNGCLHNFDLNSYDPLRQTMRTSLGTPDNTVVFLMVAAFRTGKNHHELFKIFSNLEGNWELWLVGNGPHKSRFLKAVNNSEIRTRVHAVDQILELSAPYFGADVAILPSLEESLPNFLIESQTCELPVIAYDTAGVKETFLDGETGFLIQQHDINLFQQKMKILLTDSLLRKKMGKKARNWAIEEFNADKRLEDYLKVLQNNSI